MARLILIHGGFHGSWCWERIVGPLRNARHTVDVVDLPRQHAEGAHATLDDWTSELCRVIDAGPTPVVLVAHSMGGVTASQVAEMRPSDIAQIVYVAAVVPASGSSGIEDLLKAGPESLLLAPGTMVLAEGGRFAEVLPAYRANVFFNEVDPVEAAGAADRLCAEAVAPLTTPLTLSANNFGAIAKTYIVTLRDNVFPYQFQLGTAARAEAHTIEIDTDHSPFYSGADDLLGAIDAALWC